MPYLMGPDASPPSWLAPVTGISGMAAYAATIALGVAIFAVPLPRWTGASLIAGAVLAIVSFLPLFVFVGTLVGGVGILRGNSKVTQPTALGAGLFS